MCPSQTNINERKLIITREHSQKSEKKVGVLFLFLRSKCKINFVYAGSENKEQWNS